MKQIIWLLLFAIMAGLVYSLWRFRQVWRERSQGSEARYASLLASTHSKPAAAPDLGALSQQKLLLEAATKAGEAGEAALSIQLYAKLLSRYPESSFAGQARAAVEGQKKKLASPRTPGTAGPG